MRDTTRPALINALKQIRTMCYDSQASRCTDTVLACIRVSEEAIGTAETTFPMKPHHMNRFLIFDVLEGRWMHTGYDTASSAARAANKMREAAGDPSRYRVIDQTREVR